MKTLFRGMRAILVLKPTFFHSRFLGKSSFLAVLTFLSFLFPSEIWADIAFVKTIGTGANKTTGTITSITVPASGVAAGNRIIVSVAIDPSTGTISCSDSRANVYGVDRDIINGSGTAGVRTVILSAHVAVALVSGDSISCSHPSVAAKALSANEFSGVASSNAVDQTMAGVGENKTPSSGFTATTTQAVELLLGSIGVEGPVGDKFTAGASYTAIGRAGTKGEGNQSNITVNPEYRLVSSTGTFDATGALSNSRKWAAAIVTYKGASGPPPETPDLVISAISNPPPSAVVGSSFGVTDTTANSGNGTASASTTRYRLSLDSAITGTDPLLTGTRSIPSLGAGASSGGNVTVTIPNNIGAGTYFLGACADDTGAVTESNENNNCLASATTVTVSNSPPGNTLYFSPNGQGTTCSDASPCAISRVPIEAQPGRTLKLKNGDYSVNLTLNCAASGGNTQNGTESAPIVLTAENERQATIQGDGLDHALKIRNCSWWVVDGLHIANQDNDLIAQHGPGNVISISGSSSITVKKFIARRPNRYTTDSLGIQVMGGSSDILFEDGEIYDFIRHGINCIDFGGNNVCTMRRLYINPRDYRGGFPGENGGPWQGLNMYCNDDSKVENVIVEDNGGSMPESFSITGNNNQVVGNIALTGTNGFLVAHGGFSGCSGTNNILQHNVSSSNHNSLWALSSTGTIVENFSSLGASNIGIFADNTQDIDHGGAGGQITPSVTFRNVMDINGGVMIDHAGEFSSIIIDYSHTWNGGWFSGTSGRTNSPPNPPGNVDPAFGQCKVFVPAASPFKNRGLGGADVGANILYAYKDGILQDGSAGTPVVKLWDSSLTGSAYGKWKFAGAIVAGVNDTGNTIHNVHQRLGFGTGGCTLPAGY